MAGSCAGFVNSPVGRRLATQLGLPRPVRLRRYAAGDPLVEGPVLVGGLREAPVAERVPDLLNAAGVAALDEVGAGQRLGAVVADLTALQGPADLEALRALVAP